MNFNNEQNFYQMPEDEIKAHKKLFSYLAFTFFTYLVIVQTLALAVGILLQKVDLQALDLGAFGFLLKADNFNIIFSSVLQYCIALPVLVLMIKRIPSNPPARKSTAKKTFLKYVFIGIFIMYVGNALSTYVMNIVNVALGGAAGNPVSSAMDSADWLVSLLIVGIIAPIVEELMFRKLFIDRLSHYGDVTAIIFSSLIFALFHGNLYQFFYAFTLGILFSYIYLRTGKIIYSTILHAFINVFCGVLPSILLSMPGYDALFELLENPPETADAIIEFFYENLTFITLLSLYEIIQYGMLIAGLVLFIRNLKKIRFEKGRVRLPRGRTAEIIFFNPGAILLFTVCIVLMSLNTIPF